jgi:RNA polymerase sigma-70 factor (sigma-E family)
MNRTWDGASRDAEADLGPFTAFVHARMAALLSYAHVLTGDRAAAEDVVQAALAGTALAWQRIRRRDDPEGYVRRAILNTWLNSRRGPRRHEDVVADVPEPATASSVVDGTAQDVVERDAMWRALAMLPPGQRAVIVLRYYEDLTEAEIATVLGCSPGTVKSQAAKAMAHLREQLADSRVTP